MAEKKIRGQYKQGMKRRVTAVLVAIVALFVVCFVPPEIMNPIAADLEGWQRLLARLGASLPLMFVIPWIIFAQDHLATGKSKASKFFKHHLQSTLAMNRYGKAQPEANVLWFDYFNPWEDPNHPHHGNYKSTFDRSYGLRLIYYMKRLLFMFAMAAATSTVLMAVLLPHTRTALPARITVICVVLSVWLWLHLSNNFKKLPSGEYEASGAYFKYQEICGIISNRFERDVLIPEMNAKSVAAAAPSAVLAPSEAVGVKS